ncbi:MAG: PaaI family thioesterase [Pseudomonadota bacterium]
MLNRREEIKAFLARDFPQLTFEIDAITPRGAVLRRPIGDGNLRPGGTVSGPTLMALADAALYIAILGELGIIPLAVTTNFNINFFRRPRPDRDVLAECRLLKVGRSLVVGEVTVHSDGESEAIAHATGTYSIPPADRAAGGTA